MSGELSGVAYEKWHGSPDRPVPHAVFSSLHRARLDSFLADSQDDGVMVIDADGRVIDCNLALTRRTGFRRSEVLDLRPVDIVVPGQSRRVRAAVDDALAGNSVRVRALGLMYDGRTCDLAITFVPLFDEAGSVVGSLVITQNLSEAADAERDRQRDGHLLALAGRVAGFTGWSLDLESSVIAWSGSIVAFDGAPPSTLADLFAATDVADRARLERAIVRAEREQRLLDITVMVPGEAGERHLRLVAEPSRGGAGARGRLSGAAHDVTDVVVEQRQRRAVEELLSTTLNTITDGLGIVDDEWRFTFVNDRLAAMIGVDRAELVGAVVWQAVPELIGSEFEIAFRDAVARRSTVRLRDRIEGRDAWIDAIAYPNGNGLAVLARNVTEDELAARRYQQAQDQLITLGRLLDISADAILVRDPQHRILYANAGAKALYGWNGIDVIGADARDLIDVDRDVATAAMSTVLASGNWAGRVAVRAPDQREVLTASRWQLLRDEKGEPESILSVSVDVTEEVAREDSMRRVERMDSLGAFASGIAHDLNNVLTPILMAAQLLSQRLAGAPERETATMIEAAARRGADMVQQVVAFSRGIEGRQDRVDLSALLDEFRGLLAKLVRPPIEVVMAPPPSGIVLSGDSTQLLQVLTNLVSNARDAIAGAGTITVDARVTPNDQGLGSWVVIDVTDTGKGMSDEVLRRLWEPFFTTKPVGEGTGLGLPMAAAIVRSHRGVIEAHSDGVSGSQFSVTLPAEVASAPSAPKTPGADVEALPRGDGERLLVVDDDQAIRAIVRHALETHGYEVRVASSGADAWRMIESGQVDPALVLTEITMPGGSGTELVERLGATRPALPVLLMSGRDDGPAAYVAGAHRVLGFLDKPLTASTLLNAVRDALSSESSAPTGEVDRD